MKLAPLTIILIGLSIGLIAMSYALFKEWMPNKEESGYYKTYIEQLDTEIAKGPQAKRRVAKAKEMVEEQAAKWRQIVAVHTPTTSLNTGGIDISVNPWQLTVDTRKYRNSAQMALNRQLKAGGVKVISGPSIPMPDESATTILANYYNYPAYRFPVVLWDLGQVTVQGTYEQIKANIKSWSNMPNYLAVADALQINGTSPLLTANYNLSLLGYIRGTEIFPAVPEGSGGATGGGTGGPGGPGGATPGGAPRRYGKQMQGGG